MKVDLKTLVRPGSIWFWSLLEVHFRSPETLLKTDPENHRVLINTFWSVGQSKSLFFKLFEGNIRLTSTSIPSYKKYYLISSVMLRPPHNDHDWFSELLPSVFWVLRTSSKFQSFVKDKGRQQKIVRALFWDWITQFCWKSDKIYSISLPVGFHFGIKCLVGHMGCPESISIRITFFVHHFTFVMLH